MGYTQKCLPIVEEEIPMPVLVRNKSNDLLEEAAAVEGELRGGRRRLTATVFASEIKGVTHCLLNETRSVSASNGGGYRGLDSDRDTEEQLENVLRIFPEVIAGYPRV